VVVFLENPQNGQCPGHCRLKIVSGERVKEEMFTNSRTIEE